MSDRPETRWTGREAFAEVAEALKIRTDQVLAMTRRGDGYFVVFTPSEDGSGAVWAGLCKRDPDEVMVAVAQHATGENVEDWTAEISRRMEKGL